MTTTSPGPMSDYDVFNKECPSRLMLTRLADKWSLLVIRRLRSEAVRFNQLRRDLEGVSAKMLTQTLRNLERDGLIEREIFPTVPVTVEYSLTPFGHSLAECIDVFVNWTETNANALLQAQQRFDDSSANDE